MKKRRTSIRPTKQTAREVADLRIILGTLTASHWQKAQLIYDNIVALCVGDRRGGRRSPRLCKLCKYYGHCRISCPYLEDLEENRAEVLLQLDAARHYQPLTRKQNPEHWEWLQQVRAMERHVAAGVADGRGGCVDHSDATYLGTCDCSGCRDWRLYMKPVLVVPHRVVQHDVC